MAHKIQTVWAFLNVDPETGDEGVCAIHNAELGGWMPLVCSDRLRLEQYMPLAQQIADQGDRKVVVAEFSVRTDVKTMEPKVKS